MPLAKCASSQRPFLLPCFLPERSDYASARALGDKPMSLQKARRLMTLILRDAGAPQWLIDEIDGLYSARRILPPLAHRSEFQDAALLDVGGWNDSAVGQRTAMPMLYSHAKLIMQARRKSSLIVAARIALRAHTEAQEPSVFPSWDDLFLKWPATADIPGLSEVGNDIPISRTVFSSCASNRRRAF